MVAARSVAAFWKPSSCHTARSSAAARSRAATAYMFPEKQRKMRQVAEGVIKTRKDPFGMQLAMQVRSRRCLTLQGGHIHCPIAVDSRRADSWKHKYVH